MVPTEVLLRPGARAPAERNAALGVTEEGDERLHQLVVVICEQEMLAGACLDAFRRKRRGDDGFAGGECLEHLEPHTTAEPDGRNDDCGLLEVRSYVGDRGVNSYPGPGKRTYVVARFVPNERELCPRHPLKYPREDRACKPQRGVDIRRMVESTDEEDRRRVRAVRIEWSRGNLGP